MITAAAYRVAGEFLVRPLGKGRSICVVIASRRIRHALLVRSKICKGLPIGPLRGPIGSPSRRDRRVAEGGVLARARAHEEGVRSLVHRFRLPRWSRC